MVYEEVGWRSTEVDRSRESFRGLFGRPDGFGSSDFVRIEIFYAPSIYIGLGGKSIKHIVVFLPRKGRMLTTFLAEVGPEIPYSSRSVRGGDDIPNGALEELW